MISDGDQPSRPAGPEETDAYTRAYDDALARLLDGLDVSEVSTGEGADGAEGAEGAEGDAAAAQARAGSDVALIARALRLIGAEAAGDAGLVPGAPEETEGAETDAAGTDAAPSAMGVAGVAAGSEVDARVLPLRPMPPSAPVELEDASAPARRRLPSSGVLAAAASLVLIVALGVAGANEWGGSSQGDSAAVQQPAPAAAAADGAAPVPPADAATSSGALSGQSGADPFAPDAAADAAAEAAAPAADAAAPAAGAAAAPSPAKASKAAATRARSEPLAQTAGCARAIVVGELVGVTDAKLSYRSRWTLRVTEWVRPTSGPTEATYVVGGTRARLPGGNLGTLAPGSTGLFVVPADRDAPILAWTGADTRSGREKVEAALAQGPPDPC